MSSFLKLQREKRETWERDLASIYGVEWQVPKSAASSSFTPTSFSVAPLPAAQRRFAGSLSPVAGASSPSRSDGVRARWPAPESVTSTAASLACSSSSSSKPDWQTVAGSATSAKTQSSVKLKPFGHRQPGKPNYWTTFGCGVGRYGSSKGPPRDDIPDEFGNRKQYVTLQSFDCRAFCLEKPNMKTCLRPAFQFKRWTK
eukprot:TRINITY_DN108808_c0_g1_i1.p1 TRINITY_DN108808_c0_g1~~TRINITY_DN108808_c0_g1_i1.p1  ORF type:complete len:200 (+),score=24.61 TRINITY_DN108808_c0_g1_i1:93-692(+)